MFVQQDHPKYIGWQAMAAKCRDLIEQYLWRIASVPGVLPTIMVMAYRHLTEDEVSSMNLDSSLTHLMVKRVDGKVMPLTNLPADHPTSEMSKAGYLVDSKKQGPEFIERQIKEIFAIQDELICDEYWEQIVITPEGCLVSSAHDQDSPLWHKILFNVEHKRTQRLDDNSPIEELSYDLLNGMEDNHELIEEYYKPKFVSDEYTLDLGDFMVKSGLGCKKALKKSWTWIFNHGDADNMQPMYTISDGVNLPRALALGIERGDIRLDYLEEAAVLNESFQTKIKFLLENQCQDDREGTNYRSQLDSYKEHMAWVAQPTEGRNTRLIYSTATCHSPHMIRMVGVLYPSGFVKWMPGRYVSRYHAQFSMEFNEHNQREYGLRSTWKTKKGKIVRNYTLQFKLYNDYAAHLVREAESPRQLPPISTLRQEAERAGITPNWAFA